MSEPSKTDTSLDSWEDLLENDQGSTFEKVRFFGVCNFLVYNFYFQLNEALEKIQIADVRKKTVDPFGKKSARKSSNDGQMKGYFFRMFIPILLFLDFQHLAVLYGTLLNAQDAIYKLKRHFGDTVRTKQIDGSNVLFVFSNVMDGKFLYSFCFYSEFAFLYSLLNHQVKTNDFST